MNRELLLEKKVKSIEQLPDERLNEVADFVDFLLQKESEEQLVHDITVINGEAGAFDFLSEEEDLYSDDDLIEKY